MSCRAFEQMIMTTRADDRTAAEAAWLQAHTEVCPDCARLAAKMAAVEQAVRGLPRATAPEGFTAAVMVRVREDRRSVRSGWYEVLFGTLRAPAPMVPVRQALAAVGVALMVVSAGLVIGHGRSTPTARPGSMVTAAAVPTAGSQVNAAHAELVEELIARHQSALVLQPISEQDGMRLVSY